MARILPDEEIKQLLEEPKHLPANWQARLTPTRRHDAIHLRREYVLVGDHGHKFKIHARENCLLLLDFSIILTFVDADGTEYRLTRFNGKTPSQHTNKLDADTPHHKFRNVFHIHVATERYQRARLDIDSYAEPTTRYGSFTSALTAFSQSNGIVIDPPPGVDPSQLGLFVR
jgi:hypothetical protein